MATEIQRIKTEPPSYLRDFIPDKTVILCFKKITGTPIKKIGKFEKGIEKNTPDCSLDVTGSPLKVDLSGNESFVTSPVKREHHAWSDAEAQQFPFTVPEARKYINDFLRNESENELPMWVICDGNDNGTVMLGSKKETKNGYRYWTMSLKFLGSLPKDHKDLVLESMERTHWARCRTKHCETNYSVQFKYYLYGSYIQNLEYALETEYIGCICVEVTCQNRCTIENPENSSANKKLILQVVAGHPQSSVHFLWEQLCLLQTYLDVLSYTDSCNNPDTVICASPQTQSEIHNSIAEIIFQLKSWHSFKKVEEVEFNLRDIRNENILDKLWHVLKYSENLSNLTDNFYYFFEQLVDLNSIVTDSYIGNTNISALINRILDKGVVPNISFTDALQFLFELGSEKMKNDYQSIIKNFHELSAEYIRNEWSKLQNCQVVDNIFRKSRRTTNLKATVTDLSKAVAKLAYLGNLHIATELIYLVKKDSHLSEQSFDSVCSKVCKNYAETGVDNEFVNLQTHSLCEFSVVLMTDISKELPVSWCIQMNSKLQDMEVMTCYHLSKNAIFPPSVCNNYAIQETIEENDIPYYVTKFEMQKYRM